MRVVVADKLFVGRMRNCHWKNWDTAIIPRIRTSSTMRFPRKWAFDSPAGVVTQVVVVGEKYRRQLRVQLFLEAIEIEQFVGVQAALSR